MSTYPATTMVLGELRRRGVLAVPTCAVITDFSGVSFWADRAIDMHLVMYRASAREVVALVGRDRVTLCAPLVDASFRIPGMPRTVARHRLGLPRDGVVVVVSGGGWGVGDLAGAAASALARRDVHVVCLAGRDERVRARLQRRFADEPRVTVLGFTDRISELLSAADVVVHTTVGVTCLEASVCGRPVIAFDPPAGHPRVIARAMAEAGLLAFAEGPTELRAAIERLSGQPHQPPMASAAADAGRTVLELEPKEVVTRTLSWAVQGLAACGIAVTASLGTGVLGEGDLRGPALVAAAGLMVKATRGATVGRLAS